MVDKLKFGASWDMIAQFDAVVTERDDLRDEVERLKGMVEKLESLHEAYKVPFIEGMEAAAKECEGQFGDHWAKLIRAAAKEQAQKGLTEVNLADLHVPSR